MMMLKRLPGIMCVRNHWLIVWLVLMICVSGCTNADESVSDSEIKRRAIAYMSTHPRIANPQGADMEWNAFFAASTLGRMQNTTPTETWLQDHMPLIEARNGDEHRVTWVGIPGCERRGGDQAEDYYAPLLYDSEGFQCHSWWRIKVLFNNQLVVDKVIIEEIGTEALVFESK